MPTLLKFSKYQAAGNDFILFEESFPQNQIASLCDRKFGIGADGLIFVCPSKRADFKMVYFNADGSEASLCGNGLRSFVHFLIDQKKIQPIYKIECGNQILTVKYDGLKISTIFPKPKVLHWKVEIENHCLFVVDSGVPHAVIFLKGEIDVHEEGKKLRYHKAFAPEGVNVNFVYFIREDQWSVRTYERGVEGETLSCTTGTVAAVFVAHQLKMCGPKVKVIPSSKGIFDIKIGDEMEVVGPSKKVFEGRISL